MRKQSETELKGTMTQIVNMLFADNNEVLLSALHTSHNTIKQLGIKASPLKSEVAEFKDGFQ
jgi:hypothetical protein